MAKPPKKTKHAGKLGDILVILLFFIGVGIFAYPFVSQAINSITTQIRLNNDRDVAKQNAKQQAAKQKAQNEELRANGMKPNVDVFKQTGKVSRTQSYLQKHLIGAVTIPGLKVNIPLYDVLNDTVMQVGAGVLNGTSYPTGGKGNHTVVTAHSGIPNKTLFTDLEDMKKGDLFLLTVGEKTMAYKVFKIQTIEPTETDKLQIEADKDLATLMTCTPYMVNSHRLLVTGYRVPYTPAVAKAVKVAKDRAWWWWLAILAIAVALLALAIWLIWRRAKKKTPKSV